MHPLNFLEWPKVRFLGYTKGVNTATNALEIASCLQSVTYIICVSNYMLKIKRHCAATEYIQ